MRLSLLEGINNLLIPMLLVLLAFFIPISVSVKSILVVISLVALVLAPYYRQYLYYSFNTLWARAAIGLFLFVIIGCFWSEAPFSLQYNVIDKYSKLIFLPVLAVGFIKPKTRIWVLNSYILTMLLTCVLSVLKDEQLLMFHSIDPADVFYNHIITGFMVALGVYFAAILLLRPNINKGLRIIYLIMVVLGTYQTFFLNPGRTGYIIYGVLMSLLIVLKLPLKKALIGIVVFIGAMSLAYTLSPVMQNGVRIMMDDIKLLQRNQADTSLGFRIQFHQYAQSLFEKHPLIGVGTGGFQYSFAQEQPIPAWGKKLNEPHGQYWLTLAELGLIGIVLFLFFIGTLFVTAFKLKEMKPFLLGLLVSFCVLSFSDTIFCYSTIGYLLILFSALCFGELIEQHQESVAQKA
ncbi:O-antigen ligase family protein [Legionella qingyii]|nr:O-antigen ligase family protein [Legionella qingyii]